MQFVGKDLNIFCMEILKPVICKYLTLNLYFCYAKRRKKQDKCYIIINVYLFNFKKCIYNLINVTSYIYLCIYILKLTFANSLYGVFRLLLTLGNLKSWIKEQTNNAV